MSADAFRNAILAALGHAPDVIERGRLQRFPTSERRSDRAGWCKLFDDARGGVFGCYRAGVSEHWTAALADTMTPRERAAMARQIARAAAERQAQQRHEWADMAERMARVWTDCMPLVPGDPVTLYLKRRGFGGVWPLPSVLRLHPEMPYFENGERLGNHPAMVAPIVAPGGKMLALHRTHLTRDGRKADVPQPKKLTRAAGQLAGACIPLHQPARGCIGIAEGVESALAAWCASGVPTVAAYCAGNLAAWQWPAGVQRIAVFADADKAGRDAAATLRARALASGLRCEVLTPTDDGADWCDVWAARGAVEVQA